MKKAQATLVRFSHQFLRMRFLPFSAKRRHDLIVCKNSPGVAQPKITWRLSKLENKHNDLLLMFAAAGSLYLRGSKDYKDRGKMRNSVFDSDFGAVFYPESASKHK